MQTLQIGLASLIIATQINPGSPVDQPKTSVVAPAPIERKLSSVEQLIVNASEKYGIHTDTALAIAKCESGLKQYSGDGEVIRGKVNPLDVGVFQINEKYHLETAESLGFDIYTTKGNIEYALWLMKHEGNKHWNYSRACWKVVNAPTNSKLTINK